MNGHIVWRRVDWGVEDLVATAIAGLGGGIGFGIVLAVGGVLESVGTLVGAPGLAVGVPLLLLCGVAGAFVYRVLGTVEPLADDVTDPITGTTLGVCFGLLVWTLCVALLVPLWLRVLGLTPPIPLLHWESLVGLVVYGGLVGPLSPLVERRVRHSRRASR